MSLKAFKPIKRAECLCKKRKKNSYLKCRKENEREILLEQYQWRKSEHPDWCTPCRSWWPTSWWRVGASAPCGGRVWQELDLQQSWSGGCAWTPKWWGPHWDLRLQLSCLSTFFKMLNKNLRMRRTQNWTPLTLQIQNTKQEAKKTLKRHFQSEEQMFSIRFFRFVFESS